MTTYLSMRLSRAKGIRIGASVLLLLIGFASAIYVHGSASAAPQASVSRIPYNAAHSTPILSGAHLLGHHSSSAELKVEIVLHPQHEATLYPLIQVLSTPGSAMYQHWLTPAEFNAAFPAPAFDTSWLTSKGLHEISGPSPLVLAFTGTSSQFEAAFETTINDYRTNSGHTVYANSTPPTVPAAAFPEIAGITGLDNVTTGQVKPEQARPLPVSANGKPQYGGGPDGTGLTPSQVQGIYGADSLYRSTQGQGVTTAVFELSGYTESDIRSYEQQFGLPRARIQNITVDGGACPWAAANGLPCDYSAAEVDLDIDLEQAMAPGVSKIQVYEGPNSDQGIVDTYFAIANQDTASSISTSWGNCEAAFDTGVVYGEFLAFAQMAVQGQSMSSAAGDSGPYECENVLAPPADTAYAVGDPASDPLVTAVGGTSFVGTFDPGNDPHPSYPAGKEYVWDSFNNCTTTDFVIDGVDISEFLEPFFGLSSPYLCPFGAGAGGNSSIWAKAPWQRGPGTTSAASAFGAYCGQPAEVQCREVPDVSLNADPNSGYAIYCTDPAASCTVAVPWFEVAGTSASSPLWAGIVALADSLGHHRIGLPTALLYRMDSAAGYSHALHDMVGGASYTYDWSSFLSAVTGTTITYSASYFTNTNGVGTPPGFMETRDYDMATGLGTPNVSALVPALALFA